jgi:hypothetical protein
MKKYRLNLSFDKYSYGSFETKSQSIVLAMTKHPVFTNPTPTIAELLEVIALYSDALTVAEDGGRIPVAEKKKRRQDLEAMLRKLGAYVMMIADGDRTLLISSGFDVEKERETSVFNAPDSVKLTSGLLSGEVQVRATGAKGVKSYTHEYTTDPLTAESVWVHEINTRGTHTFSGLEPAKKYWFRTGSIGSGGIKSYSKEVLWIVQ